MATTTATITINSTDLLTDELSLSSSATLTNAGGGTGMTQTSGLARKTTASTDQYTLFRADDYLANKASKIYMKNTSATGAEYFDIHIDDEKLGSLYAGDWALIPWSATDGVKAAFTSVLSGSWATGDTLTFDGVVNTCGGTETPAGMIDVVIAAKYPNWTVVETDSTTATFTAKDSNFLGLIEIGTASDDWVNSGSGVNTIARTVTAVASANDIKITPGQAANTIEYMLFHE